MGDGTKGLAVSIAAMAVVAVVQAQDQTRFRASTRLVQVSVVVEDRDGRPVTGLGASDFRLYDGDREQKLEIFLATEGSQSAASAVQPTPPRATEAGGHVFTNRMDAPRNVTVVLFDRLNTPAEHQMFARQHLVRFLQQINADDRVGLYVLEPDTVRVLHDFTNDSGALVRAMSRYRTVTPNEAVEPPLPDLPDTGDAALDALLNEFIERAHEKMAEHFRGLRSDATMAAFLAIANHLAAVEGRKNLVWVSAGFPLNAFEAALKNPSAEIQRLIRPLNDANVTVYAVDARGLVGAMTYGPSGNPAFTTLSSVRGPQDILQIAATETGGRAFLNTNDINSAVRRAVSDGRQAYTLGYYPNHLTWNGKYRQIRVQVNRPGVRVRHRRGYLATADAQRVNGNTAISAALLSPLEAVALGLTARVERVVGLSNDLKTTIATAPGAVALQRSGDLWQGAVDVVIAQKLDDGATQRNVDRRVDLHLRPDRYDAAQSSGFAIDLQLTLSPRIRSLYIVVHDTQTGATGSIIVPAEHLRAVLGGGGS